MKAGFKYCVLDNRIVEQPQAYKDNVQVDEVCHIDIRGLLYLHGMYMMDHDNVQWLLIHNMLKNGCTLMYISFTILVC